MSPEIQVYLSLLFISLVNVTATTINRRWHSEHTHDMTIHHSSPLKGLMHLNYAPICADTLLHIDAHALKVQSGRMRIHYVMFYEFSV